MHPRMIWAIYRKDLWDAIRDSRVLVAVLVPIAIGIFYNFIFDDEVQTTPTATVAYTAAEASALIDALSRSAAGLAITFEELPGEPEVRQRVEGDADLGLVIPAGFDAAVVAGESPELGVIVSDSPGVSAQYLLASIDDALRRMVGQEPPATVRVETLPVEEDDTFVALRIYEELGLSAYFVLVAAVMLIAMIAMLAVPVILAEETEKKTLDALVLIASYVDVIAAKALVGLTYIAVSLALLLGLTRLTPRDLALFAAAALLLSLALIGFGLLLGGLFKNANQLNTWSGFFLIPVLAPAFLVGLPLPDLAQTMLEFIPTSQATRLLVNGLSGSPIFPDVWLGFAVLAAWATLAFLLLGRSLARREG